MAVLYRFYVDGIIVGEPLLTRLGEMVRKSWGYGELTDILGWTPARWEMNRGYGDYVEISFYSTPEHPVYCRSCGALQDRR
jgi:hypothetical protein